MKEENKLIAEFMGWTQQMDVTERFYGAWFDENNIRKAWSEYQGNEPLLFDSSWDWLMPVVEKIEGMGCIVEIWLSLGKGCKIVKGSFKTPLITIANTESNSTIKAVYEAVVDFINWHNKKQ